jgi:hypothetical protein
MSLWSNMNHEEAQALCNDLARYRPHVGRTVRVMADAPKKHQGKTGVVFWHGVTNLRGEWRYGDKALQEVRGRYGYRVGIRTEEGEKVFVPAECTMVCIA